MQNRIRIVADVCFSSCLFIQGTVLYKIKIEGGEVFGLDMVQKKSNSLRRVPVVAGDSGLMIQDVFPVLCAQFHNSETLEGGRLETQCLQSSHVSSQLLFHPCNKFEHICLAEFPDPHQPCHLSK